MIELTQVSGDEGGCVLALRVKARPGARKNAVLGEHAGALKLSVTAAPEKGKANDALVQLLCAKLGLRRADVELRKGASSTDKVFYLRGDRSAIQRRLGELV